MFEAHIPMSFRNKPFQALVTDSSEVGLGHSLQLLGWEILQSTWVQFVLLLTEEDLGKIVEIVRGDQHLSLLLNLTEVGIFKMEIILSNKKKKQYLKHLHTGMCI
jgi:hypothetical protein